MKNKKYHIIGTFTKSNRKSIEKGKIDTANTYIPGLVKHINKKGEGIKLVFWAQIIHLMKPIL